MSSTSHQTVRLSAGKHRSPEHGVCVMELASMLAGEPFTDRPESVCPVIGAFLRTYNDGADDDRRQDLYACAALVVGSRADRVAEQRRAERCREIIEELQAPRTRLARLASRASRVLAPGPDVSGMHAARILLGRPEDGHARALELVRELVAWGLPAGQAPETPPTAAVRPPSVV